MITKGVKQTTDLVHLIRDAFKPILARLDARDHARQFGANDGLVGQGFSEHDALRRPPGGGIREKGENNFSKRLTHFKDSSTINLCADIEVAQTIHRS